MAESTDNTILPCPFCGAAVGEEFSSNGEDSEPDAAADGVNATGALVTVGILVTGGVGHVFCEECGAEGPPGKNRKEAIALWNGAIDRWSRRLNRKASLTEEEQKHIHQAIEMLGDYEETQRRTGNDSIAMGAGATRHVLGKLFRFLPGARRLL